MIYDIVTHPNKKLREKSKRLLKKDITSKKIQKVLLDMKETMVKKDGVGLAAPQIGIQKRIITICTKDGELAFINPRILKRSWKKETDQEGCLSVPGVNGDVKRNYRVLVEAYNENAIRFKIDAKGLMARIFQHEIDHLDGILFIDTAKNIKE